MSSEPISGDRSDRDEGVVGTTIKASLWFSLAILLGRVTGFFREATIAYFYGASDQADVLVAMLTVPDLLISILIAGALSLVFIPELTDKSKDTNNVLRQGILVFGSLSLFLVALFLFNAESIVRLCFPGFEGAKSTWLSQLLQITIWIFPLTIVSGIVSAHLQSENKFFVAGIGALIINLSIICGIWLAKDSDSSHKLVGYFLIGGGFLRLLVQVANLKVGKKGERLFERWYVNADTIKNYALTILSFGFILVIPFLARSFSSHQSSGSVSIINYAIKLIEFSCVFCLSVGVVLYPKLTARNSDSSYASIFKFGMASTCCLGFYLCFHMMLFHNEIAEIVYGRGKVRESDLLEISNLTYFGYLLIPIMGVNTYIQKGIYSKRVFSIPLICNLIGLSVFVGACSYASDTNEQIIANMILANGVILACSVLGGARILDFGFKSRFAWIGIAVIALSGGLLFSIRHLLGFICNHYTSLGLFCAGNALLLGYFYRVFVSRSKQA